MNTRQVEEYLKRLENRQVFLEKCIENEDNKRAGYDKRELMALRWAIRYIEDTILEAADHQYKWFNELEEK